MGTNFVVSSVIPAIDKGAATVPDRTSSNSLSSQSTARREAILDYLRNRGGRIESPSGVGLTAAISDAVGYGDVGVLNGMLSRLEQEGLIVRDIRGRRTFAISLTSAAAGASRGAASSAASGNGSGGGTGRGRARSAAPRKTAAKKTSKRAAKSSGPRASRRQTRQATTGRQSASARQSASSDGSFVNAAGALMEQLSELRTTIDELTSRGSELESGSTATAAPATARKTGGRKATAKRSTAKKSGGARKAAKRTAKRTAKGATKRTTAKKVTAKRTTTR